MKSIIVCVLALFLSLSCAFQMRPVSISANNNNIKASPFNGTYPLGTLLPGKWNQTEIPFPSSVTGVPLSSIWIFFSETSTGKPLPGISFSRASLTLITASKATVYNALTSSLDVARTFSAEYPFTIPAGNLSLAIGAALALSTPTNVSVSWIFTQTAAAQTTLSRASLFVPAWTFTGEAVYDWTTNIPFDAVVSWAVGNIFIGGESVTLLNNNTGAVICNSVASATGDMPPCTPGITIPKGSYVTVVVKSNSTGIKNFGGIDIYMAKLVPTTTTSTVATTAATTASSSTAASTAASSSHAAGPAATAASTSHAAATSAAATSHAAATSAAATSHAAATTAHAATTASTAAASVGHASSGSGSGSGSGGHSGSGSGSGGHSGSGDGSGSGGTSQTSSGSQSSSGSGTTQSGSGSDSSGNGVTMGYSSGSSGSSGSSSGGAEFLGGHGSLYAVKKGEIKHELPKPAAAAVKSPKKMTLADLKKKAISIADEVEDSNESENKHFRVLEEKASNKFL